MLSLGGGWWGSRRADGQLRYVIVVVDRGELIEASMSVRMRGRANERVRVFVLSVPGCLPRYLRLIITFLFSDFPHVRAL